MRCSAAVTASPAPPRRPSPPAPTSSPTSTARRCRRSWSATANVGLPANPAAASALTLPAEKQILQLSQQAPLRPELLRHRLPDQRRPGPRQRGRRLLRRPGHTGSPSSPPSTRRLPSSNEPSHERSGRGGHRRAAGHRQPGSPATRRPPADGWPAAPGRKQLELIVLLGPALALFAFFVLLPICIAAYYGLFNWSGYGHAVRLRRPAQLPAGARRPGVPRVGAAQRDHRGAVAAGPAAASASRWPCC